MPVALIVYVYVPRTIGVIVLVPPGRASPPDQAPPPTAGETEEAVRLVALVDVQVSVVLWPRVIVRSRSSTERLTVGLPEFTAGLRGVTPGSGLVVADWLSENDQPSNPPGTTLRLSAP